MMVAKRRSTCFCLNTVCEVFLKLLLLSLFQFHAFLHSVLHSGTSQVFSALCRAVRLGRESGALPRGSQRGAARAPTPLLSPTEVPLAIAQEVPVPA